MNYFELFGLPEQFELDGQALERRYRELAAQWHPDKFASKDAFTQKEAMLMSTTLNDAWRTLRLPLDRAAYLLAAHALDVDAPEHTRFAPEFLMQQMQWRDTLEEAACQSDTQALQSLRQDINAEQAALLQSLAQAFAQKEYERAGQLVRQGRFLHKLLEEIRAQS